MFRKTYPFLVLALGVAAVFYVSNAKADNKVNVDANSYSGAISGSQSGSYSAGGSGYSGAGASAQNAGNAQTIQFNTQGSKLDETVPTLFVPGLTAGGNNCAISVTGGVTFSGFGGAIGVAYESDECNARAAFATIAQSLRASNNPMASTVLKAAACQSQHLWKAMELAAAETGRQDLACINPMPKGGGTTVPVRAPESLPAKYSYASAPVAAPAADVVSSSPKVAYSNPKTVKEMNGFDH